MENPMMKDMNRIKYLLRAEKVRTLARQVGVGNISEGLEIINLMDKLDLEPRTPDGIRIGLSKVLRTKEPSKKEPCPECNDTGKVQAPCCTNDESVGFGKDLGHTNVCEACG